MFDCRAIGQGPGFSEHWSRNGGMFQHFQRFCALWGILLSYNSSHYWVAWIEVPEIFILVVCSISVSAWLRYGVCMDVTCQIKNIAELYVGDVPVVPSLVVLCIDSRLL